MTDRQDWQQRVLDEARELNEFRGWIHAKCNTGLGMLGDSIEGLALAMSYMESVTSRTYCNKRKPSLEN